MNPPSKTFADDRNMVESQLSYEKRLKDSEEIIGRWRGEAGVLKKKNGTIGKECEELRKEIELLGSKLERFQQTVKHNQKDIDGLKRAVDDRENIIKEKEKRVQELHKRNQDLEKLKQALTHKVSEMKMEIEPREMEIREKKERIFEMERELKLLQQSHLHSGLKLSELKDKFFGTEKDLKIERSRSRIARAQLMRICSEIYEVSGYIQRPDKLKEEVIKLYHRYSNDSELKNTLALDTEVQNEFNRQRDHFEKVIAETKTKQVKKKSDPDTVKLLKENVTLITELNRLRTEFRDTQKENNQMRTLLGISGRQMLPSIARKKLAKAVSERDELEKNLKEEIEKLQSRIDILVEENLKFRSQIS